MNTTKYSVTLVNRKTGVEEPVALLSASLDMDAIGIICGTCVNNYSNEYCYAIDMETGEMVFNTDDEDDYFDDIYEPFDGQYDELNYDPYMGCDYYECESIDDLCYGGDEW